MAVKIKNSLDLWVAFLTKHELLKIDALPKELNSHSIQKALAVIQRMNFNEEEKGIDLGVEKSRKEIAVVMLAIGLDINLISSLTKLTLEEISQI